MEKIKDACIKDLGLKSYENGYYQINESFTLNSKGEIRIDRDSVSIYIAKVNTIKELEIFIKCINR